MKFAVLFNLLFFTGLTFAQDFADKKFYLLDSLDVEQLDPVEKRLLDKQLRKYHAGATLSDKLKALNTFVQESDDNGLWPAYNKLIIAQCESYLEQEKRGAERKTIIKLYADALNDQGYFYSREGKKKQAIAYYEKCLPIFVELKDKAGEALCYNNIGSVYDTQGDVLTALKYYFKALKIAEKNKDWETMALCYSNIGVMYDQHSDYAKALKYYKQGKLLQERIDDRQGLATTLNNIGFAYGKLNDHQKAIQYYSRSLDLYIEFNEMEGIATALANIGNAYHDMNQHDKALEYFEKSLVYDRQARNNNGLSYTYSNIGRIYLEKENYPQAEGYAQDALKIAQQIGSPELIRAAAALLSDIHEKQQRWEEAFRMQGLYHRMKDSVSNTGTQKELITLGLKYDFEKEKSLAQKEHEKKMAVSKKEKQKQRLVIYFTLGILLVVFLFLLLIINRFRVIKKQKAIIESQKHLVEEKNREITDSITYAKRIQSAILPPGKLVKEYFSDSFILYKPKDIVAGDFYWFEVLGDLIFFAVADCTGHGVPGAMVSVVCHNALNRSVKEFSLKKPSDILDKTREIVISEFEKSDEDVKDGMDISLCAMSINQGKIFWSGAHSPLWIIRNDQVIEYKADKQPIGKYAHASAFTNHEIELHKGDEIYISTDGFQDQFGGPHGKKFKASQMKTLLLSYKDKSMDEKKTLINTAFENWQQGLEQVDDVCVIGVRL